MNNVAWDPDDDNDTLSDLEEELITGTDPLNAEDCLRMLSVDRSGTNVVVSWKSVSGKSYWMARSTDLMSPTNWLPWLGPVNAVGGVTSITDSNPPLRGVYRVGIRP